MSSSIVVLVVLAGVTSFSFFMLSEDATAKILYVGGTGPGNHTTIQSAINVAGAGDIVYVYSGTYHETLIINQTLSLIGEDKNSTFVDGDEAGHVIRVASDWVNISGFTVMNGGSAGAGIWVEFAVRCSITDNTVRANLAGVSIRASSRDNLITNNTVESNVFDGIQLIASSNNTIGWNSVFRNGLHGIYMQDSNNNAIVGNNLSDNDYGVNAFSSFGNRLFHNRFIGNTIQAVDGGTNVWDDGYPSGGNYWSDYTGVDEKSGSGQDLPGNDGIGDTPYPILSSTQVDRYPLMSPTLLIYPRPPSLSSANLSGSGFENVTIEWSPSPDDGLGLRSVVGYKVYRNETYEVDGEGYALIASLPNGTAEFVDTNAGEGDLDNHFYRVCAFDFNNNVTCSVNQVGKFTRPLSKGPNLLSFPLVQSDETIQTILQTVPFDNAWSFDSTNQEWKSLAPLKPYLGRLTHLNHTVGFWLNVTSDSNFTVAGVVPRSTSVHLSKGWNLISFPSFKANYTVTDLVLETNATRIESFSQADSPYHLRASSAGDHLLTGFGYWIVVEFPVTWTMEE